MFSKLFYTLTVFLKLKISFEMMVPKKTIFVTVNSVHGEVFCMLFCCKLIFSKSTFSDFFQEYQQSVKQLKPRPGPTGLGPNCLQRLSADDKRYKN